MFVLRSSKEEVEAADAKRFGAAAIFAAEKAAIETAREEAALAEAQRRAAAEEAALAEAQRRAAAEEAALVDAVRVEAVRVEEAARADETEALVAAQERHRVLTALHTNGFLTAKPGGFFFGGGDDVGFLG